MTHLCSSLPMSIIFASFFHGGKARTQSFDFGIFCLHERRDSPQVSMAVQSQRPIGKLGGFSEIMRVERVLVVLQFL